jgi:SOS-response transcriptional repressor LexA
MQLDYPQVKDMSIPIEHLPIGKPMPVLGMDKYEFRRQRLIKIRDEKCGGNAAELARRIGKDATYVTRTLYPEGKPGKKRIADEMMEAIERSFPGWLGESSKENTSPGPNIRGNVPLISWVQAGAWCETVDIFEPGYAEEWMPCPVNHGDRTFVLKVRGESMFNPHGRPSFIDGDLIFVDPDRQPEHGSLVVVRMDDAKDATFKKLMIEGDRKYLRALNPAWPEQIIQIDGNATICGVVIFKGEML